MCTAGAEDSSPSRRIAPTIARFCVRCFRADAPASAPIAPASASAPVTPAFASAEGASAFDAPASAPVAPASASASSA
eukprot:1602308-Prymnesium_polylepis.1